MFEISKARYDYIVENVIFNVPKKEREIFDFLVKGYNAKEISNKLYLSERTTYRRIKTIKNKIEAITSINEKNNISVYILIFPNQKVYIGQSSNVTQRWNNGEGYKNNKKMYDDIEKYGWNSIEKKILYKELTISQALIKETETIVYYKSYMEKYGYNTLITQ